MAVTHMIFQLLIIVYFSRIIIHHVDTTNAVNKTNVQDIDNWLVEGLACKPNEFGIEKIKSALLSPIQNGGKLVNNKSRKHLFS